MSDERDPEGQGDTHDPAADRDDLPDRAPREAVVEGSDLALAGEDRDPRQVIGGHEVAAELLDDWRIMFDQLHARFDTGDFATGLRLVNAIGEAAESADHHPDVDLSYPRVDVRLTSHDVGGVTARDVDLAREISRLAAGVGATARPEQVSVLELGLDTHDRDEVVGFWSALLGYETTEDPVELRDPDGRRPTVWFQESERRDAPAQRWHLDLRLPPEVAEERVRRAVEAGGTLVSDGRAPTFWVLADAQGNQACVTTWLGRGSAPADGGEGHDADEADDTDDGNDGGGDD